MKHTFGWRLVPLVLAPLLSMTGCSAAMSENALLDRLVAVMNGNMPPYKDGWVKDVSGEVCPLVSPIELDTLVGLKLGEHEVETGVAQGMEEVKDGSRKWLVTRSKPLAWSQSIFIIIEPGGKCLASIRYEAFGA